MKNYLNSHFKSPLNVKSLKPFFYIALFLITLSGCETEHINQPTQTSEQRLEQAFSLDDFKDSPALQKEDILIDWTSAVERKFDTSIFYEFSVTHKNASIVNIEGYVSKSSYRLLARFDENDQPEYFLVELLPTIDNTAKDLSYIAIADYSGMAYVFDTTGEKIARESYEVGVLQTKSIGNGIGRNLLPRQPTKCAILEGLEPVNCSGGGGCSTSTVTIQHWEYFYDVSYYQNTGQIIDITYSHRESRGQTIKQVTNCHTSYTPPVNNTTVESVTSNPPEVLSNETETYPFPDCVSWEYGMRNGVRAASVIGFYETFIDVDAYNTGIDTNAIIITFPTLYFTAPIGLTNGQASTATAAAMYAAQQETSKWYKKNSSTASKGQVSIRLFEEMKKAMKGIRGTVSTINSYNMINPAPYKIDLLSLNNCD
ncbi:hypothetical protein [Aquimarina aggregata]|uniref:hypothetical protein n=1 Tax=Aquimarina aggregata TaxID=1642818 RepID=UPI002491FE34|nr:hypothetical protein [Aquimarina aggregata]